MATTTRTVSRIPGSTPLRLCF
uniref:Uncharacterized protein n=1 Tax=Anguilla anguilla TaxID=7936 RepID=A0A0E9UAY0_ANGAN